MAELQQHQELCQRFATMLSYPVENVVAEARACSASLKRISPEAAVALESFIGFLETNDISRIEEAFTGTFDLQTA